MKIGLFRKFFGTSFGASFVTGGQSPAAQMQSDSPIEGGSAVYQIGIIAAAVLLVVSAAFL